MTAAQAAFMREAIRLAENNVGSGKGGPFGAVVVKGGEVIARATNLVTETHDPTAHAEVVAIREACRVLGHFQLAGCEVYASCEPCPMCLGALYWARPDRVFFVNTQADAAAIGFDDQFIYEEIDKAPEARRIPMQRLPALSDEALRAFAAWRESGDRELY